MVRIYISIGDLGWFLDDLRHSVLSVRVTSPTPSPISHDSSVYIICRSPSRSALSRSLRRYAHTKRDDVGLKSDL